MCWSIARKLADLRQIPLECRYLEGSRYAWRMAEGYLEPEILIDRMCVGGLHVTLRSILLRGGLGDAEAEEIAGSLGKTGEIDRELCYEETRRYRRDLLQCGRLREILTDRGREAYENTLAYFRQEGLTDQVPFALVDSGWVGTLQQTVSRLVESAVGQAPDLRGFYFGLYELPEGVNRKRYETFYFRPWRDIGKKVRFSNCLFEAVCSSDDGMTVGYRREAGRMVPIRACGENANAERILANLGAAERFLDGWNGTVLTDSCGRLVRMMTHPTPAEAMLWGSYRFSDDVRTGHEEAVAADLSRAEIRALYPLRRFLIMKGIRQGALGESAWAEGSIVLAGGEVRRNLRHFRMYKRMIYIRKALHCYMRRIRTGGI